MDVKERNGAIGPKKVLSFGFMVLRIVRDLCLEGRGDGQQLGPPGIPMGPSSRSFPPEFSIAHVPRNSRGLVVSDKVDGVWLPEGRGLLGPFWTVSTSSPLGYWESNHLYCA